MTPAQLIEFLGLMIDSVTMSLSLPEEKVVNLRQKCQNLIQNPQTTVGGSKFNRFPVLGILPAFLQMRYIQHISVMEQSQDLQTPFCLNKNSIKELNQ